MDEVDNKVVSEWAFNKLVEVLREFREGSAPFHAVVSRFTMCENLGLDRLMLNAFARGILADGAVVSALPDVDVLAQRVESLPLPGRVKRVLIAEGLQTVGQVLEKTERQLLRFPNFGKLALRQLREALAASGLELRGE